MSIPRHRVEELQRLFMEHVMQQKTKEAQQQQEKQEQHTHTPLERIQ